MRPPDAASGYARYLLSAAGGAFLITLLSRLLGFYREQLLIYHWGQGPDTAAFYQAYRIPDAPLFLLTTGALHAYLAPPLVQCAASLQLGEYRALVRRMLLAGTALLGLGTAACIGAASGLARLVMPGAEAGQLALTAELIRILMPVMAFGGLAAILGVVLHSRGHFVAPVLGWCLFNLGIIGGVLLTARSAAPDIRGAAWGAVAGAAAMLLLQAAVTARALWQEPAGKPPTEPAPDWPPLRRFGAGAVGGLAGYLLLEITCGAASYRSAESVAAFRQSDRLLYLPLGLIAAPLVNAAFPVLCRPEEESLFRQRLADTLTALVFLLAPAAALIFLAAPELVRLAYGRGAFEAAAIERTAALLRVMALGLPLAGAQWLFLRALLVRPRLAPLAALTAGLLTVHLAASLAAARSSDAALAAALVGGQLLLLVGTIRLLPPEFRLEAAAYRWSVISAGASVLMGAGAALGLALLPNAGALARLGLGTALFSGGYALLCLAVGHPILTALQRWTRSRGRSALGVER